MKTDNSFSIRFMSPAKGGGMEINMNEQVFTCVNSADGRMEASHVL